jgi:hypothetical protein
MEYSQEEIEEIWFWNWEVEWSDQMKEFGYVILPHRWQDIPRPDYLMALLSESRWTNDRKGAVGSTLWDGCVTAL